MTWHQGQEPHTRFRRYALSNIARRHLLTLGQRVVLSELTERADYLSWTWKGSASDFARDTGLDREMISAAVTELKKAGLVSILEPFRRFHKAIVRIDCYGELVADVKEPSAPVAARPTTAGEEAPIAENSAMPIAGRIAGRIEGRIAETPATPPIRTSPLAKAPNRATEEQRKGDGSRAELSREKSTGRAEQNGSTAGAFEVNEDHGLVRQVVGGMVPLRCPDCGGWPCQCLF